MVGKILPPVGFEPDATRSRGQCLSHQYSGGTYNEEIMLINLGPDF